MVARNRATSRSAIDLEHSESVKYICVQTGTWNCVSGMLA